MKASEKFASTPLLIEFTLVKIHADCTQTTYNLIDGSPFCSGSRKPCIHAVTLRNCLQLSHQWFEIAAKQLWGNFATLGALGQFLEPVDSSCVSK